MTMAQIVKRVREEHRGCCLTTNCRERACSMGLRGFDGNSLAIIHGSRYQRAHRFTLRLCDRIIFSSEYDGFVGAVELKSGRSLPKLSPVIDQIRGGLLVAEQLLNGHPVPDWYPILAYSGHMGPTSGTALRANASLVRFQDSSRQVIRRDCNSELAFVVMPDP